MMKRIICFLLTCQPLIVFCQQVKKIQLLNNKVEVSLPVEFEKRGDPPDENIFLYTNKERDIKFSISVSDETISDNDIPGYTDLAINSVKKESASAKIYDDGISLNDGKNIGYVKYATSTTEIALFEYVFYGSLNDKLITFYFSCSSKERQKWEKKIDEIVSSVRKNSFHKKSPLNQRGY